MALIKCKECGKLISEQVKSCPDCGYCDKNNNSNSIIVIICAIIGLLFPIIGAILYYALKKTDYHAAKVANTCAWISFGAQIVLVIIYWGILNELVNILV